MKAVSFQEPLFKIGQIIKTRGLKGELKIYPYTEDYCMQQYCELSSVWVGKETKETKEYSLIEARVFKNFFLFFLRGIDTPHAPVYCKAICLFQKVVGLLCKKHFSR